MRYIQTVREITVLFMGKNMVNIVNKTSDLMEPILRTFQQVKPYLPTLSPFQYNYYKAMYLPTAQTVMQKLRKSWNEILRDIGLSSPLDRDTLSTLSRSLHLLEKKLVRTLGLGWNETTFTIKKHKLKPDSFYLERAYLQNRQILLLDVKLSLCSSIITIYKYLPIFENPPVPTQMTFFSDWVPEDIGKTELGISKEQDGQLGLFCENNFLYISYLVGVPQKNLLPGSEISFGRVSILKKKKIPPNMEVKFLEFKDLPELYSKIAGISYKEEDIQPILEIAEEIKKIVLTLPPNAQEISRKIYKKVKLYMKGKSA